MRACTTDAPACASVWERARVCVWIWAPTYFRQTVRALSVGVDRVRLGSQAFQSASAFNANIGAWNTASVYTLYAVCAASGPAARHRRRAGCARPVFDAARPLCAAAPTMRARVRARIGTRLRRRPRV
jgi:hypothetical protein